MTLAAAALLGCLTLANFRVGRSVFYPPALFTAFWTGLLGLLWLCGDRFYPLLDTSLAVFVVGAACFSAGGLFGRLIPFQPTAPLSPRQRMSLWRIMDAALLIMIVCFPIYLYRLDEIIAASKIIYDPLVALRYELTNLEEGKLGLGLYRYLISLFDILTLIAWCESDGSRPQRRRCWLMAAIVLAYHVGTAGRVGAMQLVVTLSWIAFFRRRKIAVAPALIGAIVLVFVFSGAAILLEKGGRRDAGLRENAAGILDASATYLLAGQVAFNAVVADPSIIQQDLFSFFCSVANALGADFETTSFQSVYVQTPEWTNVFTIYMSPYAQFGFLGVALYMLLVGAISSRVYGLASQGSPWAVLVWARIAASLLFTGATDPFLRSLSIWIQLFFFVWVNYELSRYLARTRRRPWWELSGGSRCSQSG